LTYVDSLSYEELQHLLDILSFAIIQTDEDEMEGGESIKRNLTALHALLKLRY
jgi:hypothetical protein